MKHSEFDKYRLPNESDVSWTLRKEFIERYKGDFQEETLLSLAKAYSDVESGRCSNAVTSSPVGPVAPQHEQSEDSCEKNAAESAKGKQRTSGYSGGKTSVKMKQKASATQEHTSLGASSQKRTSHKAFQANSQKEDGVLYKVPTKKSRVSDLKSYSEGSDKSHSIMSKANSDVTVKDRSLPSLLKNQHEETGACEEMSESDTVNKAKVYSLGEKVLEINTWPPKLKRNFISILQFVRKCFSKELITSEILHSTSKRFKLKLQYCIKQLPLVKNCPPVFECALKVDSVQLSVGYGSTLHKARIAAAKEVIDKLIKLSEEVENLSYFNTSGRSVEHMKSVDENVCEIGDTNMNNENERIEHVNEFDSTPKGNTETHGPRGDVSVPCQHDLSQGRSDTQCEGGRQNTLRSMMQLKCPTSTEDLGSDVAHGMGIKPTLNVDSRSHVLSTAECDIVSLGDANNSPLVNANSCGGREQQNFDTEVVDQSVEGEAKSCAFKKAIRFSDGFCITFEFDKDNQLLDVSGNDSPTPRCKAVQTSLKEINKKLTCEVVGVKSSVSHKSESMLCDGRNLVIHESDLCLENINDKTNQNSTCCKEKSLKTKIIGNTHIFSHANNPNMNLSNCSKNLIYQNSGSPNHPVDKRWKSCWDTEQRQPSSSVQEAVPDDKRQKSVCDVEQRQPSSSVQETTAEVHPQEIENTYRFSKNLGVPLDITRSTMTAQNAFNTANGSTSDPSQSNSAGLVGKEVAPNYASSENCASAPVDPRTVKPCNRSNGRGVPLSINRPSNLLNTDSNSSALYEVSLPQENTDAFSDRVQISANIFQTCVFAESTWIFGLAVLHIERLISKLANPTTILRAVSRKFSLNIKYDYTLSSDTGHVCVLSMDNIPMCKAYGVSQKRACLEACKWAVYKLVELATKTEIIHSNNLIHLLMWYNSKVPAERRFPVDLNSNPALSGMSGRVATSEVVSQRKFQKREQSSSYVCTANQFNAYICENSSQQICSAFLAILDYTDIVGSVSSLSVLRTAAELSCVQLKLSCEVVASYTGLQIIRATVSYGDDFSIGTAATEEIALEIASKLALDKLRKTAYTIKMKYEHFDGFVIHHDQVFEAIGLRKFSRRTSKKSSRRRLDSEKENFRVQVKKLIEDHYKTNPYRDLLFCAFNKAERKEINKVAEECCVKTYDIGGKNGCPRNVVITRFFTAYDLLRHLTEAKDYSCRSRYEIIPPSEQ